MRICNPPQARMLREDMKSQRLREYKKKEKEGKTPLHLTQKTRKTRKISQNDEKSQEKLGGYWEKEYIRCGYQAVGYQYDAKQ